MISGIPEDMKQGSGSSFVDGKPSDIHTSWSEFTYVYDPDVRRGVLTTQNAEESHKPSWPISQLRMLGIAQLN